MRCPGGHLPLGYLQGGQTLRQALPVQRREFNLGHVQLTGVLGGVMHLKPAAQPARLFHREALVKGGQGVRVEIIQHQHDLVGAGIVDTGKLTDKSAHSRFVRCAATVVTRLPTRGSHARNTLHTPRRSYS